MKKTMGLNLAPRCWMDFGFCRNAEPMEEGAQQPARGIVFSGKSMFPGRTGRRSRCCGFAEGLGLSRAELYGMNIGCRELKMTAWSVQTSLTKWDPLHVLVREIFTETSRK